MYVCDVPDSTYLFVFILFNCVILSVCHFQINGQDVQDREEAMATLSNDECRSIVLLVARPEMQVRNYFTFPFDDTWYVQTTDCKTYSTMG